MATHNAAIGGYPADDGSIKFFVSCTCGFNVQELEEDVAKDFSENHWKPNFSYVKPVREETLFTSKGHEITVTMSDQDIHTQLRVIARAADDRGRPNEFVDSLVAAFSRRGSWSAGQRPWAHKLVQDAEARAAEPAPERSVECFDELLRIIHLASAKLKYPKIVTEFDEGVIKVGMAGSRAKYPRSLNVTNGGTYEDGKFYGRIHLDGTFEASRNCPEWVLQALIEFNADPVSQARLQGQRYGTCCFCCRHLETDESVTVGYGPICADHYGLPWGAVVKADNQALLEAIRPGCATEEGDAAWARVLAARQGS